MPKVCFRRVTTLTKDGGYDLKSETDSAEPSQSELPQGNEPVTLDPAQFTTEIDNPYWPMKPGTRWTYRETDAEGKVQQVVVVVTHQTKKIANGITARVVRDTVTEGGKITTKDGSFEAGVDGALPGINIPGDPEPGMEYRQEYYKGQAEDNSAVLSTNVMAEVPYGKFKDVLLTKDTIALGPDVLEYKLYAKGVGPVLILGVSGGAAGKS